MTSLLILRIPVVCLALPAALLLAPTALAQRSARTPLPDRAVSITEDLPPWSLRVVILGDFGHSGPDEAEVAARVHLLDPDLLLSAGDNNYPSGQASTIDANIGQYYSDFMHPYLGAFGPGGVVNRFFPSPGNHDWITPGIVPYLSYFVLPGNERYYTVRRGPVQFFSIDSDSNEPDGNDRDSLQALWLANEMAASNADYRIVFMHHSPYGSSSSHGSSLTRQWRFREMGVDAVFTGHDHVFERLDVDGLMYSVNGLGGRPGIYGFEPVSVAGSRSRYRGDHGLTLLEFTRERCMVSFVEHSGAVFDQCLLVPNDPAQGEEFPVPSRSTWKYFDLGTDPGATWNTAAHDDSSWVSGDAHMGYGDGDEATVLSFGPDPLNKYITTWFRHDFTVSDPASVTQLRLDLLRDDGAVVYLNGIEVVRSNMPAGAITASTLSASTTGNNPEDSLYEFSLDPADLQDGANLLAVEIHQRSAGSSDISFDLQLSLLRNTEVLSPRGAAWSYLDDGSDQGSAWTAPGFNDSSWSVGTAQFGYGDGDETTVVDFGGDVNDRHVTTYFRRTFNVADASHWKDLRLHLLRDDGAVVYLNGVEAYRFNLPLDGHDSETLADAGVSSGGELLFFETRIDHDLLVDGDNVIAVEIHQQSPTSDDLSFDLELVGRP